jgi:hypothetical protein
MTRLCLAVVAALLLAACGSATADEGVASLDEGAGAGSEAAATESASSAEEQLLEWVECARGEGLDIPDPTVDAEGNLTLRPGNGGNAQNQEQPVDRDQFEAVQQACGPIPQAAIAGAVPDEAEFQDAALEFAQCMRDRGIDVPDPDVSNGLEGLRATFGDLRQSDDPETQEAVEECSSAAFGDRAPGRGGENAS